MSLQHLLSNNHNFFRAMFVTALVICSYLFFSQQDVPTNIAHSDKYGHILVFFVLSLLLYLSWFKSVLVQVALLTSYGIAVEVIQSYIPYRSGGIDDVVADVIGIALFHTVARLAVRKLIVSTNND